MIFSVGGGYFLALALVAAGRVPPLSPSDGWLALWVGASLLSVAGVATAYGSVEDDIRGAKEEKLPKEKV